MDNAMSVADVAALSGGMGGGMNGMGGLFWIFALLILAGGGFGGGFGWGGAGNVATQNDVQRGFDAQNSMANEREILAAVTSGTAQSVAATNQSFHDTLGALTDKYGELQRDIAGVALQQAQTLANQNECCCSTKMMIAETGAGLNAAIAGLEQRLTSKMDANTIQSLRDQVDALRDQVNMSGVLRFPNTWSYGAGPFPPIYGGCCGNA